MKDFRRPGIGQKVTKKKIIDNIAIQNYKEDEQKLIEKYEVFEDKKDSKGETIGYIIIIQRLAEMIYNEYEYHFITMKDTEEIYFYNGSYYQSGGEQIIRFHVERLLGEETKEYYKNQVVGYIRDKYYLDRMGFNPPLNLINLKNGVYNIGTGELLSHSPDNYFITEIPVDYVKGARCEVFEQFMIDICKDRGKSRPLVEKTLAEYMGYMLYRGYPYKKYLVLDGPGDNGKTQYIIVCEKLIGQDNNTGVSLHELNNRPFAKCQLYGRHANISDDLPKKALKYTGVIKQITGGSPLWADIKNNRHGINFTNFAKPIYACNELPETDDVTDAFFSRQLQITLNNKYIEEGEGVIDNISTFPRVKDIALNKLATEENMPDILNYALEGLHRLLNNDGFSLREKTDEKRERWLMKTNPVHAMIESEMELTSAYYFVTVDDFASELKRFCIINNLETLSRKKITEYMKEEGLKKAQRKVKGKSGVWCWLGLQNISKPEIDHNNDKDQNVEKPIKKESNEEFFKRFDKSMEDMR